RRYDDCPSEGQNSVHSQTPSREASSGGAHVAREALAHLRDLGNRNSHAVALAGVLREEVLVVLLGLEEDTERRDDRDDATAPGLGCPVAGGLEELALRVIRVEHLGAVLGADIRALAVQLPRVMQREEDD